MKRTTLFVWVALLLATTSACLSATITVPTDYPSIGAAVAAATNGDIINVLPGAYTENVIVDKSVSIRGMQGSDVMSVTALATSGSVFSVITRDVTISGFTISGTTDFQSSGVLIGGLFPGDNSHLGVTDVTVSKCVLENNCTGVYVWKADNSMIVNNTVRENSAIPPTVYGGNGIIA